MPLAFSEGEGLFGTNLSAKAAEVQLTGVIVVFFCLVSIAFIISIVGKIFIALDARKSAVKAAVAATPATSATPAPTTGSATSNTRLTPELVAVIAAAVDTALEGRSHRILNISQSPSSPWAISGRTDIFASHRLNK